MPSIRVGNYQIFLHNPSKSLRILLMDYEQICVVIEPASKRYAFPIFEKYLGSKNFFIVEIDHSIQDKTLKTCEVVWDALLEHKANQKTLLINLGSGTLCDIGGFCASTFNFGIDFIHVPTTLVSQVGASVGGKMGIDYKGIKNALGVYRNPKAVYIIQAFLQTLSKDHFNSGLVEIVKYGLIAGGSLWQMVCKGETIEPDSIGPYLEKVLIMKKQVFETDPEKKGIAKILNFGNTIAHAIRRYLVSVSEPHNHGAYIASGIICQAILSKVVYGHSDEWLQSIIKHVSAYAYIPPLSAEALEKIADNLTFYKVQKQDVVYLTLLKDIGTARYEVAVARNLVIEALEFWNDLGKK
jgi:3-dehydroquinate synthase